MTLKRFQALYLALLLGFAGVLSVSGTIALRNVLHDTDNTPAKPSSSAR